MNRTNPVHDECLCLLAECITVVLSRLMYLRHVHTAVYRHRHPHCCVNTLLCTSICFIFAPHAVPCCMLFMLLLLCLRQVMACSADPRRTPSRTGVPHSYPTLCGLSGGREPVFDPQHVPGRKTSARPCRAGIGSLACVPRLAGLT